MRFFFFFLLIMLMLLSSFTYFCFLDLNQITIFSIGALFIYLFSSHEQAISTIKQPTLTFSLIRLTRFSYSIFFYIATYSSPI